MNERDKHYDEAEIALRVSELSDVAAEPSFRERLRSEFVSGRIEGQSAVSAPPERARPGRQPAPRGVWWRWAVPVLAGVAAVAVVMLNRGPVPQVIAASGTGELRLDGRRVALADQDAWRASVRPGVEIETPRDAIVDILVDGVALYEVTGGTRMTIPRSPGRWFGRTVECSLFVGELRLKTGSDFKGAQLRVHTPDGLAEIVGTLVSVQCDANGTCVCVHEGTARVGVNETDLEPVEPGNRKIMMRDGTVDIIPVAPPHRDGLIDFNARVGKRIEK